MIEQPLLASTAKEKDFPNIKYPVIGTPKLDGIRCLIVNGKAVSRNFKEIPNKYVARILPTIAKEGMDGELVLKGDKPFNEVSSAIMRFEGEPDFEYQVFDWVTSSPDEPYVNRIAKLKDCVKTINNDKLKFVDTFDIGNERELQLAEAAVVELGYEGLMIRSPNGKYKFGRSSFKEGILLKIKRFEDSEAIITGFEEKRSNQNEAEINVFGYTERCSKKEGIVLVNTLGAIYVTDTKNAEWKFKLGTGFNDEMRKEIWTNREKYLGKVVKYKYQPSGGKDLPRFPVFLGFRHENDVS